LATPYTGSTTHAYSGCRPDAGLILEGLMMTTDEFNRVLINPNNYSDEVVNNLLNYKLYCGPNFDELQKLVNEGGKSSQQELGSSESYKSVNTAKELHNEDIKIPVSKFLTVEQVRAESFQNFIRHEFSNLHPPMYTTIFLDVLGLKKFCYTKEERPNGMKWLDNDKFTKLENHLTAEGFKKERISLIRSEVLIIYTKLVFG
jgi:hypothetical protein